MFSLCIAAKKICTGALVSALVFGNIGWSTFDAPKIALVNFQDTIPGKNRDKDNLQEPKDIDQHIEQLNRAMEKLNNQLQNGELEKIQQKVQQSISAIDVEAIQNKIDETIKKMDFSKLQLDAAAEIKKIDWQKIQQNIQEAMAETNNKTHIKELQRQLQETIKEAEKSLQEAKKIDYEKIKKEMDKNKIQWQKEKINIEKQLQEVRESMINNKETFKKEFSHAREEIEKAMNELQSYKTMINNMAKDGLLNSKENYTIDYEEGNLLINGKSQSQEITDKYKSYFKKQSLHIKNKNGNFSINDDK